MATTLTAGQVDETQALAARLARIGTRLLERGETEDGIAVTDAALKLRKIAKDAVEDWAR